jgi:PAS domain S-box-containing protein
MAKIDLVSWPALLVHAAAAMACLVIAGCLFRIVHLAKGELRYKSVFYFFGVFAAAFAATHAVSLVTLARNPAAAISKAALICDAGAALISAGGAFLLALSLSEIVVFIRASHQIAARRGEERFRAVFLATPLAVISVDPAGLVTSWNPGAEAIFGFRHEEVVGQPNPIVPSSLREEYLDLLRRTLEGAVTKGLETFRQRRDGKRIPVSISSAPLYDEHGKAVGVVVTVEDISGRRQMAQELHAKSAILQTVTRALNTFLEVGDWAAAGRELLTFAAEHTASEFGFLAIVLEDGNLRLLASDGTFADQDFPVSAGPFGSLSPKPGTEMFNLQTLFAQVVDSREIVIANRPRQSSAPEMAEGRGHFRAELGSPVNSFLGVPIFKGAELVGFISVVNRKGGYTGHEWESLDTMSRATGVLFDSYRQNLTRAALEQKQASLEAHARHSQNMELLARVSGGIAHDFNNMLMIISGSSELLERALGSGSLASSYISQIQQTTTKAARIAGQLLAFSSKQLLDLREVNLHTALSEAHITLTRILGPEIRLEVRTHASHCWIRSDASEFVQILGNLAANARDAMPRGGDLFLSTRNTLVPPDSCIASDAKILEWAVLEVRDTGIGMDQAILAQIFEPFFTTKPFGTGAGLGLSTVYGVVRQSGGYIQVHSTPGKGSCFELYFPVVVAPKAGASQLPEELAQPQTNGTTLLLVDDEAALVQAIGEFLRESGFVVLDSFSPHDALALAAEYPGRIDLLVSDVVMPGMRGPELYLQLLELQPEIRVLFMSGYAEGLPEMNLPPGTQFLQKPFRFSSLLDSLRKLST